MERQFQPSSSDSQLLQEEVRDPESLHVLPNSRPDWQLTLMAVFQTQLIFIIIVVGMCVPGTLTIGSEYDPPIPYIAISVLLMLSGLITAWSIRWMGSSPKGGALVMADYFKNCLILGRLMVVVIYPMLGESFTRHETAFKTLAVVCLIVLPWALERFFLFLFGLSGRRDSLGCFYHTDLVLHHFVVDIAILTAFDIIADVIIMGMGAGLVRTIQKFFERVEAFDIIYRLEFKVQLDRDTNGVLESDV